MWRERLSRMQSLSDSRGGSNVTKPIFSNSRKLRLRHTKALLRLKYSQDFAGKREATTGNTSAVRKLHLHYLCIKRRTLNSIPGPSTPACSQRPVIKQQLDWIGKTWIGLIKHGVIKHEKMQGVTGRTFIPA